MDLVAQATVSVDGPASYKNLLVLHPRPFRPDGHVLQESTSGAGWTRCTNCQSLSSGREWRQPASRHRGLRARAHTSSLPLPTPHPQLDKQLRALVVVGTGLIAVRDQRVGRCRMMQALLVAVLLGLRGQVVQVQAGTTAVTSRS